MNADIQREAAAYERFLHSFSGEGILLAAESSNQLPHHINEIEAQSLWMAGLLGTEGETLRHGKVRIIDFGEWNRSAGPDFQQAEIELNGTRIRGDIELDPTAQDWEHHGHGANPAYNNVVLHVTLSAPPQGWYTRDSLHRDIPIFTISPALLAAAYGKPKAQHDSAELCSKPLSLMSAEKIASFLKAAAAYRMLRKRRLFRIKAQHIGESQAWYESLAETLGYKVNKHPMQMLARRAPLKELGHHAESILFGTAGFLVPILPEQAGDDTRQYHRSVWDAWWAQRAQFELGEGRNIQWQYAPIRPVNHPHRRVAALAQIVKQWKQFEPLFNAAEATKLCNKLTALSHPYWDIHYTLASARLNKKTALIGSSRARDFLINHVYVQDESPAAWETYLSLKEKDCPSTVKTTVAHLFGNRDDLTKLLQHSYAQQGLLQINADYCSSTACSECQFPVGLSRWQDSQ